MPLELLDERLHRLDSTLEEAALADFDSKSSTAEFARSGEEKEFEEPSNRSQRIVKAVCVTLLMASVFITTICYTISWGLAYWLTQSIEYEGHVLWACSQIANGKNIYDAASLVGAPWAVTIYNPLYFVVGAALMKVAGVAYLPLRLVSMVSFLASCVGIHCLLKRCKVSDMHSLIAVACFAAYLPTFYWSFLARVDMLGLALGIWGLERFVARWPEAARSKSVTMLWSSILLFLLSIFTKQSGIYFPLAAVIFAFGSGQKELAARFLGAVLIPLTLIAATINLVTGGYFAHLGYATSLPWEWDTLSPLMTDFLCDPKTIAAFAIVTVGSAIKRPDKFDKLAMIFLAIALTAVVYTMGVRAAFHNHLQPVIVGVVWLMAVNLRKLPPASSLIVLACMLLGFSSLTNQFENLHRRCIYAVDTSEALDLVRTFRRQGKSMLVEDPSLAIFTGAEPGIVDGTTIFNISRNDPFSLNKITEAIEKKQYSMIALNQKDCDQYTERIWPARVVFAIKRNYEPYYIDMGGNGNNQRVYIPVTSEDEFGSE